jgi:hypothetical protein
MQIITWDLVTKPLRGRGNCAGVTPERARPLTAETCLAGSLNTADRGPAETPATLF